MSSLSELIRGVDDRKLVLVPTPEWGSADGKIFAQRLSSVERNELWEAQTECRADAWGDFVPFIVARCARDSEGNRVFSDDERTWLAADKSAVVVDRVFRAIDNLNLFSVRAEEEAKKNYAPTGDSAPT